MKKGFTLVELLVSVSILTVMMSVVLFNYGSFNDNLALSTAAQEVAVAIRQIQAYGLNVKEATPGSGQFNYAYGIHFIGNNNSSVRLFIDSDNDREYDPFAGCWTPGTECIERVDFRNGIVVSNVCDATTCPPVGAQRVSVLFLRPNPDALIYFADSSLDNISGPVSSARIQLTSPRGKVMYVNIESTGQVTIQ